MASGPNSVQHEYSITLDQSAAEAIRNIITLQQVRKFFDFYGISIGQNVSNFSPCSSLHLFGFVCLFFLRLHFSANICQRLTTTSSPITRSCAFSHHRNNKNIYLVFEMEIGKLLKNKFRLPEFIQGNTTNYCCFE